MKKSLTKKKKELFELFCNTAKTLKECDKFEAWLKIASQEEIESAYIDAGF